MSTISSPTGIGMLLSALVVGQAITLTSLLWASREERTQHRWLVLLIVAVGLNALGDLAESATAAAPVPFTAWLTPLTSVSLLLVGPALWCYARSLTDPQAPQARSVRVLLHFLPALLLAALLWSPLPFEDAAPAPAVSAGGSRAMSLAPVLVVGAYLAAYAVATLRRVRAARRQVLSQWSALEGRTLTWLLQLASILLGVVGVWLAAELIALPAAPVWATLLCAAALGLIGVAGVRQRHVLARHRAPQSPAVEAEATAETAPEEVADRPRKYARAALSDARVLALRDTLARVMTNDKPHLQNDLALPELAAALAATPHELSQLLTQHLGETFYDFVNRHRVDAVRAELSRPRSAARPLLEVALECGFGSKSAFNDAFKRHTGTSPSEYRRRLVAA